MTMKLARQAIKAFPYTGFVPKSTVKAHRRAYIQARLYLGENWILAKKDRSQAQNVPEFLKKKEGKA